MAVEALEVFKVTENYLILYYNISRDTRDNKKMYEKPSLYIQQLKSMPNKTDSTLSSF